LRYAAAYGILRGYIESLLVNFAESFSEDRLAEIRIALDQLRTLVREDEHIDEATVEKLDQLAQALRESDEGLRLPHHDPYRNMWQKCMIRYRDLISMRKAESLTPAHSFWHDAQRVLYERSTVPHT
jgi:hypothetical protein